MGCRARTRSPRPTTTWTSLAPRKHFSPVFPPRPPILGTRRVQGCGNAAVRPRHRRRLLDARSLFLTPNTTTVYGMVEIDVKDGPDRRRHSAGCARTRGGRLLPLCRGLWSGRPRQGQGRRYVFAHQSYNGELPRRRVRGPDTHLPQWWLLPRLRKDGDIAAATRRSRAGSAAIRWRRPPIRPRRSSSTSPENSSIPFTPTISASSRS